MCRQDDADTLAMDLPDLVGDQLGPLRVKPRERFVQHDYARVKNKHAGEAGEAFLATTQVVRDPVFKMAGVDGRECLTGTFSRFATGDAAVLEAEHPVIKHRGGDKLCIGVLEDELDLLSRVFCCRR